MPVTTNAADPRDRLIFALDVPTVEEGKQWVERLGDCGLAARVCKEEAVLIS